MNLIFKAFCISVLVAATAKAAPQPAVKIVPASTVPVAIDDAFEFRKTTILNNDDRKSPPDTHPMVGFEKNRVLYGAITPEDLHERKGQYYSFYWKAKRQADVTVRFEYRQAELGSHVQAREVSYPAAKGSHKTEIDIIGDDFHNDGRVIAWRAFLIVEGRVAAVTQSYLWK
jgi:hypothetical protein